MSSVGIYLLVLSSLCTIQNLRAERRPTGHRQLLPFDQRVDRKGGTIAGLQKYIVNGNDSIPNRYPYQVAMVDEDGEFYCGATLIAPDVVLTAAHCEVPAWVSVGRHYRNENKDDSDRHEVLYSYRHPRYVKDTLEFDMKLLKLRTPTDRLPILLNDNPDLPTVIRGTDQNIVTAVGFGKTQEGMIDILQEADLNAISNQDCRQSKDPSSTRIEYRAGYNEKIFEDMLCLTDIANSGKDSCTGDSGGPAILKGNTAEEDVQVGVISWAFGCGLSQFPGVYSRISHEYVWLSSSACVMSDELPLKNFDCGRYFGDRTNDADGGQMVEITITIRFGLYPDIVSWAFNDATTYETLAHKPSLEYASLPAGAYLREAISLPAGSNITFAVWSLGTNGLQTLSASFQDDDDTEVMILDVRGGCDGYQDSVFSLPFVLPSQPTSQPTIAPTTDSVETNLPTEVPTSSNQTSEIPTTTPEEVQIPSKNTTIDNIFSTVFKENQTDAPSFIQHINVTERNETESPFPTASQAPSPSPSVNSSFVSVSNSDDPFENQTSISPTVTPTTKSTQSSLSPSFSTTPLPSKRPNSPPRMPKDQIDLVSVEADSETGSASLTFEKNPASSAPPLQDLSFHGRLLLIALPAWSTIIATTNIVFG